MGSDGGGLDMAVAADQCWKMMTWLSAFLLGCMAADEDRCLWPVFASDRESQYGPNPETCQLI